MENFSKKISDKTLTSENIEELILQIERVINEKKRGHANYSKDDIKQLRTLQFLLRLYEEDRERVGLSTQKDGLNYNLVKNLLDELDLNQIITSPLGSTGGHFTFEILDRVRYRDYIYGSIQIILDKSPKEERFAFLDKILSHVPAILVGILITVLSAVILHFLGLL